MTDETRDPWITISAKRVYENPWIVVEHREVLTPTRTQGVYGIVHFRKYAVGVVPIDDEGYVHLVGQWRPPLNRYSWEIPEGGAEPGEDTIVTARREMAEETGLEAANVVEILRMDLSNSITDEIAFVYLATGLKPGKPTPDDTEELAHKRLPFGEALNQVLVGQITDSMSVAGLLRAYHMAKTGQVDPTLAKAMLAQSSV
jgi:8-oxo-dGTP pyrophosphatase MutT (NUDIX family)